MTSSTTLLSRLCAFSLLAAGAASAQLSAADDSAIPQAGNENKTAAGSAKSLHSWELPALTVQGGASPTARRRSGRRYAQPRWTTTRRFTEVRTYVIPEGQFDFEYWLFVECRPPRPRRGEAAGAPGPSRDQPAVRSRARPRPPPPARHLPSLREGRHQRRQRARCDQVRDALRARRLGQDLGQSHRLRRMGPGGAGRRQRRVQAAAVRRHHHALDMGDELRSRGDGDTRDGPPSGTARSPTMRSTTS